MLTRPAAFPAFHSRNFRLFFAGQLVSLTGTWMQQIAMTWLAYRLSDSSAVLGLVGFAGQIPILLFSAYAGVWNDRLDRRRLLMVTQALSMAQALLLFTLTLMHLVTPGTLVVLAFLLGCINAIDLPARQAFVVELVHDKAHLPNAIGLNSFLMNGSRFVGPALAGLLVATAGEAACFLLNALSYLAVLLALAAIRSTPRAKRPHQASWAALRDGLVYAFRHPRIRLPLLMIAGFSFCVTPYAVMMPVFARDIYHGNAQTYGFLIASAGFGSLTAALFLALRGGRQAALGLDRLVARAALAGGVLLTAFALNPVIDSAYPLLMILGGSVILTVAGSNTVLQTEVEEEYRGRVMALFSTAFLGIAPLGSLAVGTLGETFGVRPTLLLCGLCATGLGIAYLRQQKKTRAPATAP
jgi:MFS family permease